MLPSLGALPLVPTNAKDDVVTEIVDERQDALHKAWGEAEEEKEEAEALGPQMEAMRAKLRAKEEALRERYRAERRAAPVRGEVFDNEDLVKEVLLALDKGDDSWDVCKMVVRWCSLNKARNAACDDQFWNGMGERIWGKSVHTWWLGTTQQKRFRFACEVEHEYRNGTRRLVHNRSFFNNVKRLVLAAIAFVSPGDYRVLQWASDELRDDEEVVRAAVAKDARAIRFASSRLQALVKLKPTLHWPKETPTDFERRWGEAILHIMLHGDWDHLTANAIRAQLAQEHPELPADSWPREELNPLLDELMAHVLYQGPDGLLEGGHEGALVP